MNKRTKIICTIGPATESPVILSALIKSGMNIARLNFSHGTHDNHKKLIKNIRAVAKKNKAVIGIIADLQGPKIRLGEMEKEIILKKNESLILTTEKVKQEKNKILKIGVTYNKLHKDVKVGDRILINDGLVELLVQKVREKQIFCKVKNDGSISSHKGMNFPDSKISSSSLTAKDKKDLFFAMSQKVDFTAISFVRSEKDIILLNKLIEKFAKKLKVKKPRTVAKIEKGEALENFAGILDKVDGIMVARGDLGIEISAEDVPLRQKEIIALCRQSAKPVIIATQMLDSMIRNPRPTRAEVSDVANAVMDNVDAVMLSGETASGKYPKEAVEMMSKIIIETEESPYDDVKIEGGYGMNKEDGLGKSVNILIRETGIKQVTDFSSTDLYRYVSKWRPEAEIFRVIKGIDLYPLLFWGVNPVITEIKDMKKIISRLKVTKKLKKKFILLSGEDKIEIID
ncbi:MAG: pyruvate kinase [Parcubacteria group bacterium CG10_big_fil_rev_8_21_14_0_10_36_14]|nr:MAG: pyruvate kinase [Parcubacteria group bacterium CG10_big_fil_rev_8_21_14_0_10_36_14]